MRNKINKDIGAIIFSRFDSTRLYGKALIDIEGRPLLGRVIDRALLIKGINKLIVATSKREIDDPIHEFALSQGIKTFRGSCEDVYGRSLNTCEDFKLDGFIRICGDRPFLDYELISKALNIFKKNNYDLVTTMFPRTYPPGLTIEIIKKNLLKKFENKVRSKEDRENLTSFFYKNSSGINIKNIDNPNFKNIRNLRFVVDIQNDLDRARWIAKNNSDKIIPKQDEIISLAFEYEELQKTKNKQI